MSYRIITKEEYKGEPVQYVGCYVLKAKEFNPKDPEVFFVEEDKKKIKHVKIDNTIYEVIKQVGDEVCILQVYEYADKVNRQLRIWTKDFKEVK